MSAEIWTICLFSSQRGSRPERPASGLHSLRWNAVAAWLPNQTTCESSVPAASHVWLLGCFLLRLPNAVYTCLFMLPQDALFTKMEHITAEWGGGKKKRPVFTGSSITNKWTKKSLIGIPKKCNCNVSETAENTRASNLFKGDKWFWSTLLLRNNRGGCTVKALSFGRPLIGSVEQQNCVYSS